MSLMRFSRLSPARRKIWTYLSCSGERGVFASRSAMPMIAFIGVRISWLMLARKSDLVRLALSAAAFACFSSCSNTFGYGTSGAGCHLIVYDRLFAQHALDASLGPLRIGEAILERRADQLVTGAAGQRLH